MSEEKNHYNRELACEFNELNLKTKYDSMNVVRFLDYEDNILFDLYID